MFNCLQCETVLEPEYKFCPECGKRLFKRARLAAIRKEYNTGESYMDEKRIYQIGDRGPANGWIFFKKGNTKNGWQYLEAAPEEAKISVEWGIINYIFGMQMEKQIDGPGGGKENTLKIIEKLRENGKTKAVQFWKTFSISGFNDWYIPSCEELLLMFENLYLNGFGRFRNNYGIYVASSAVEAIELDGGPASGVYGGCANKIRWVRRF